MRNLLALTGLASVTVVGLIALVTGNSVVTWVALCLYSAEHVAILVRMVAAAVRKKLTIHW